MTPEVECSNRTLVALMAAVIFARPHAGAGSLDAYSAKAIEVHARWALEAAKELLNQVETGLER